MEATVILIICNIILLIGVFYLIVKKTSPSDQSHQSVESLSRLLSDQMHRLTTSVDDKLGSGLDKTYQVSSHLSEKVGAVMEAQKQLAETAAGLQRLSSLLIDSKQRGLWGEKALDIILYNFFGTKQLYSSQYRIGDGYADFVIHTPSGLLAIDAKFPANSWENDSLAAFVKSQIKSIATKYIKPGTTLDFALLYLPTESIYREIFEHHFEVVDFGWNQGVHIVGPSSIYAVLTSVLSSIKVYELSSQSQKIIDTLKSVENDVEDFVNKIEKRQKNYFALEKDMNSLVQCARKMSKKIHMREEWVDNGAKITIVE